MAGHRHVQSGSRETDVSTQLPAFDAAKAAAHGMGLTTFSVGFPTLTLGR